MKTFLEYINEQINEAGFEVGGKKFLFSFGKYYKDGERITRDEYWEAKEKAGLGSKPVKQAKPSVKPQKEVNKKYSTYTAKPGTDEYHDEKMGNIKKFLDDTVGNYFKPTWSNPDGKPNKIVKTNSCTYELQTHDGTTKFKFQTNTIQSGDFRVIGDLEDNTVVVGAADDPETAFKKFQTNWKKKYGRPMYIGDKK